MQIHRFIFPFPTGGKTQAASSNISPKPRWRGRDGNGVDVTPASLQRCRGHVCLGKPTAAEGSRVPALPGGPTPPPSARPAGTRLATSPGGGRSPRVCPLAACGRGGSIPGRFLRGLAALHRPSDAATEEPRSSSDRCSHGVFQDGWLFPAFPKLHRRPLASRRWLGVRHEDVLL